MNKPPLKIREKDWTRIEAILRRMLPSGIQVWAYGSRVTGEAYEASDLDLALIRIDGNPIAHKAIRDLKTTFSESNVPIIVDVHDKSTLPASLQNRIDAEAVLLFEQIS